VVVQAEPKHPLLMKSTQARELVARRIRELNEVQLRNVGNWTDLEMLGDAARLNSVDVDDEEIFQPSPQQFECLATLNVTLSGPNNNEFEETFSATVRGIVDEKSAKIERVQIDTDSFSGETASGA
jgi:hypothetical protein